jgi:hypothetical protein
MLDSHRYAQHTWVVHLECMEKSKHCHDPLMRRFIIRETYDWLDRHFAAVEALVTRDTRSQTDPFGAAPRPDHPQAWLNSTRRPYSTKLQ